MLRSACLGLAAALVLTVSLGTPVRAQDPPLVALLKESPQPPNSLIYVNPPALKALTSAAEMEADIRDQLEEVWSVGQLDLIKLEPQWEAGYARLKRQVDIDTLAKSTDGYIDTIAGRQVVWTPDQTYLAPGENNEKGVGFLRPANRSLLGDWFRSNSNGNPSPYLSQAATKYSQDFLSFMIAIDLSNAYSPVTLEQRLKDFDVLKDLDSKGVAKILSSTEGISVIVGRRNLGECILSVDFGMSPAALEPVANVLLNEILNRNGTAAPEVLGWKPSVDGNKLSFQGAISEDSLHGLLGIFTLRRQAATVAEALGDPENQAQEPSGPNYYDSKKYFDRVNGLIDRTRKYEAQSTGYRAKWNDQNARRIDELGTLGVDPVLIDYGSNVSSLMRNNASAIRQNNVQAGQQQAEQGISRGYYGARGYHNGFYPGAYGSTWGYYDANTTVDYQRVTGAKARMQGFGSWKTTLSQIDQLTGNIRRQMTDKYQEQF